MNGSQATTQAICRHTMAVLEATEVMLKEVTQVPKWSASAGTDATTRPSADREAR